MKFAFIFLSFLISYTLFSQNEEWKPASKESEAYHQARLRLTIPPYGLSKVKELVKTIKFSEDEEEEDGARKLDDNKYQKLSFREKFTYNMIHAESYSQNCDAMPPVQDEDKKIFAYPPDAFDEYHWSARQIDFFETNKDSVVALMTESIKRTGKVGLNFKQAMWVIKSKDIIPVLIDAYKKNKAKKDLDILTIFMLMMKESNWEPFLKSTSYKKLYGNEDNYQSFLIYNKANEDLIIKRVTGFYNGNKN
jgi:hypothetical protein